MTPALFLILLASSIAVVYGDTNDDIVSLRGAAVDSFIAPTDEHQPVVADSLFIEELSSFVVDVTPTASSQPSLPSHVKCRIGLSADCTRGAYCAISPGVCKPTLSNAHGPMTTNNIFGQCKTRPYVCNYMYAPICACDGKTYSNSCVAASTGVNVAHEGECNIKQTREECVYRSPGQDNCTNANEYCVIDERKCMLRIYEQRGYCETRSIDCSNNTTVTAAATTTNTTTTTTTTAIDEPICGCDVNTYKNACLAHNAGINIMHNGECNASDSNDGDNDNTVPTNNDDVPKYPSLKSRITILIMAAICYAVFLFMIYYAFVTLAAVTDREQARRAIRSSNRSTGRSNAVSSSTTTSTTDGSTRRLEVALLSR